MIESYPPPLPDVNSNSLTLRVDSSGSANNATPKRRFDQYLDQASLIAQRATAAEDSTAMLNVDTASDLQMAQGTSNVPASAPLPTLQLRDDKGLTSMPAQKNNKKRQRRHGE